mgnify:CR=1 FL=1
MIAMQHGHNASFEIIGAVDGILEDQCAILALQRVTVFDHKLTNNSQSAVR